MALASVRNFLAESGPLGPKTANLSVYNLETRPTPNDSSGPRPRVCGPSGGTSLPDIDPDPPLLPLYLFCVDIASPNTLWVNRPAKFILPNIFSFFYML